MTRAEIGDSRTDIPVHDSDADERAKLREAISRKITTRSRENGRTSVGRAGFEANVNRRLTRIMAALDLDKEYVSANGTTLEDSAGRRYLDFAGAYGALPFGHCPDAIWKAISDVREDAAAIFVQPSVLGGAGALAQRLAALAPGDLNHVTFVNSGAEATEIAIKIARSATGRMGVLSTDNSFHGKTLGALSVTGRTKYQAEFGAPVQGFERISFGDLDALEQAIVRRPDHYALFFVEPIQAEGGVNVAPPGYLAKAREICERHGVLLGIDEVQTGLGRTGRLFACTDEDVVPDILTLAKALGGGVLPTGAVLTRESHITEGFALRHTSTFAGNALAARVGMAVLDELTRDDGALLAEANARALQLKNGLGDIARRYPGLIAEIRGRGLLLGVELTADVNFPGFQTVLGSMADQETLTALICSRLLNVHGIRIAPTFFGHRVLRIEPPLTVSESECDQMLKALDSVLEEVAGGKTDVVLSHLIGAPHSPVTDAERSEFSSRPPRIEPAADDVRFAFVAHPINLVTLADFDPALARFSHQQRRNLLQRMADASSTLNPAPFLIGSGRVVSQGTSAYGELVGLPYTAADLLDLPPEESTALVQQAVDWARERGATLVGLGAYSSIVSGNAAQLDTRGCRVTTGNAFTAAASVAKIRSICAARGVDLSDLTAVVIGGGGAIGRAIARQLISEVGTMVLVGRRGSVDSPTSSLVRAAIDLAGGTDRLDAALASGRLVLSDDPVAAAPGGDIVVASTSSPHSLLGSADFATGAIVCDVAQPSNIPAEVARERPDLALFDGGIVRLPGGSDFSIRYGLPPGNTFACMAETMLLALSGEWELVSSGSVLEDDHVRRLAELSVAYGFELADASTYRYDDSAALREGVNRNGSRRDN